MPRFLIIRRADAETEAGAMPTQELMDAMTRYHQEMANAGILLDGQGLHPSAKGARVDFRAGKPAVTDGPFAETKELIAGFSMINVASLADAIAWAKKWPALDAHGGVKLEIRQVVEVEDFGEQFTPAMREMEAMVREKSRKNA